MSGFEHAHLDAYREAVEIVGMAHRIAARFPRGTAELADQLRRASRSIALNLAEGAGEFVAKDKARFYRMARRSAAECDAILDVGAQIGIPVQHAHATKEKLQRVSRMLTSMILRCEAREPRPRGDDAQRQRQRQRQSPDPMPQPPKP